MKYFNCPTKEQPSLAAEVRVVSPRPLGLGLGKPRQGHLLPALSDSGENQQHDANHHCTHNHPKNNQPYDDWRLVGGFQCRINPLKLQAAVIQAESVIDTVPGHAIRRSKTQQKGHFGKIQLCLVIYPLWHWSRKDLTRLSIAMYTSNNSKLKISSPNESLGL